MKEEEISRARGLLNAGAYPELDRWLADADLSGLAAAWSAFKPLFQLVLFKLMDPPRALELYARLTFEERYFLLCGFPLSSIAPVLEGLPPAQRALFHQPPREYYDRMFRQLVSERVELAIPLRYN